MHASFVEAANAGFSNTVKVPGRDSLGLGAGVRFNTDKHVSFSLNAGSELFRRDATSVYGNLAVNFPTSHTTKPPSSRLGASSFLFPTVHIGPIIMMSAPKLPAATASQTRTTPRSGGSRRIQGKQRFI